MENKRRLITLISTEESQDDIGQIVTSETQVQVIGSVRSVSLTEWTDAGQLGLSAQYLAVLWSEEYGGQETVEIGSKRYHVYRTYDTGRRIELYLEEMVGHGVAGNS